MKKLLVATLLSLAAASAIASTTSDIPLPVSGTGVVPANGGTLQLSLQPLIPTVQYNVECNISNATQTNVGVVFSSSNVNISGSFKMNGQSLPQNQGYVLPGNNDLVDPGISLPSPQFGPATINFLNSDNQNVVTVSNCVAHFVGSKK